MGAEHMTRIGWLQDAPGYTGGAELTATALRAAAPDDVEIVDCPPGEVEEGLDLYLLHNVVTYGLVDLQAAMTKAPAFKYWNDVGGWYPDPLRKLIDKHATAICCSPLQQSYMRLPVAHLIPPPIDLGRFERAAALNGHPRGTCSAASWRNLGKGARRVVAWAQEHNVAVDYYGGGPFAPEGATVVPYGRMPKVLASYNEFLFLPTCIEPFGRLVAEAWAAGCRLIVNQLVGAIYWIQEKPDALRTAAGDYWDAVLAPL
jgi:hypothetical protein